ncbi:MAG: MG2 domain-containing protein, partial [Armatimonadetes bacterium]|nr:MG2 domain-containing protein [Armatimonadota bacterium]
MRRRDTGLLAAAAAILWLAAMSAHLARQETPTGWLRGTAVAEESGQPLVGAEVRLHLMSVAPDVAQRSFVLRTRASGAFRSKRIPAGAYRVEASSRAHVLDPTILEVAEGESREVALELKPVPPFFDLRIPQHVFTPDEVPQVIGEGFLPDDAAAFTIYRVDAAFLFGQHYGSLWQMLRADQLPEPLALQDNPNLALSQRLSAPITQRDVEGVFRQRFDLPIHEPGVYLVAAEAAHIQRLEWIMVTRIGLVAKHWGDEGLAYVIDLKTGQPVPGARVEFTAVGGPTVSGTTDEQGIFQHSLPGGKPPFTLLARAEKDGSEAFTTERVWRTTGDSQDRVYVYTDRPVYRPGHRVSFKGVARRFADNAYSVPAQEPVEVEVRDSRDTLVYRGKLATNEFGSYHGEFDLNDEAATGLYQVISTVAGRPHWSSFDVAEYRKPEYSVDVTPKKKRYTRGDRIQADISAQYYFGAPVAGAEVSYIVRRDQYWFYPFGREQGIPDDFESYGYGEVIDTG